MLSVLNKKDIVLKMSTGGGEDKRMSKQHLIWEVYDNYRTTRLNVKYYSARLDRFVKWNMAFEIAVAISAPGSVISGLWFLKTANGLVAWQCIAACTAVIGFLKLRRRYGASHVV